MNSSKETSWADLCQRVTPPENASRIDAAIVDDELSRIAMRITSEVASLADKASDDLTPLTDLMDKLRGIYVAVVASGTAHMAFLSSFVGHLNPVIGEPGCQFLEFDDLQNGERIVEHATSFWSQHGVKEAVDVDVMDKSQSETVLRDRRMSHAYRRFGDLDLSRIAMEERPAFDRLVRAVDIRRQ